MPEVETIRNIGIIAHIDAGKTTTTERILYYSGAHHKIGEVDEGTTKTDWRKDEQERGITITSASIMCSWKDHTINLIDTPGHVDFTAEVERSLRVLDGAVGIFCAVGGVEAQSETVWRQANRYRVPRIAYVNKMDRTGADFDAVLEDMRSRLSANPVVITMPWGKEKEFLGVIDILKMKALTFDDREVKEEEIPEELREKAEEYYHELVDALADLDDEIIEKFSEGELTTEDLKSNLRRFTLEQKILPTYAGASFRNKGVQCVLDGVVDFLPSPSDVPPIVGINTKTEKDVAVSHKDSDLCALAFKTDCENQVTYVRVYSGELKSGMQIYNPLRKKPERVNRLCQVQASQLINQDSASAGHIVGVVGLRYTNTGDTLTLKKNPIVLEKMQFPETVISKTIEPRTASDKEKLITALERMSRDDPTLRYVIDEDSEEIILSGMGELHLDIIHNRIFEDHKVKVKLGKPRVSYRETILKKASGECRLQKQFSGKDHFACVKVTAEPTSSSTLEFVNNISEEKIPSEYRQAVEEGAISSASSGDLAGYSVINVKITVDDGEFNPTSSSEMAFSKAAYEAVKSAMTKAQYALLEPIMKLQVQTPVSYVGDVISNLHSRRVEIEDMELRGDLQTISAKAPLAEMFGYSNDLRTLTQGRGSYAMEPLRYSTVPSEIQEKLIW